MAQTQHLLCLGDSYTIGESVFNAQSFPFQTVQILKGKRIPFFPPTVIAKTGWTTDELAAAIAEKKVTKKCDFVTLLIGVNNQYRKRDLANYEQEFTALLNTALEFVENDLQKVIVLSIPDWGVTPFLRNDEHNRSAEEISIAINQFNAINKKVTIEKGISYLDITPHSRMAKQDVSLLAKDKLHPSEKMYNFWAKQLAKIIQQKSGTSNK